MLTACLAATAFARPSFNVRDYGAVGDNATDDTGAFEKAIAAAAGGGQLLVPAGGVFLIRPVNLSSSLEFYIQGGATVAGIADHTKWPVIEAAPSYGQGRDHPGPRYTSLLHGEHVHDVTIRGDGPTSVLDGRGAYWWARHKAPLTEKYTRGHLIELMYSQRIAVYDITMKDSPFWNNHFLDCDGVHVKGVTIVAPDDSPNTDGWDPDSATNVLIEDSTYRGGDDCIAIKSGWDCFGVAYGKPSANITVRNLTCDGHVAGVAIGSEMSGGVENITIQNIRFVRANGAAHIKTGQTRGGYVSNVVFEDLVFADGAALQEGILIDAHYGAANPSCPKDWKPKQPPRMANYTFRRIDGRAATLSSNPFHFKGSDGSAITGVYIEDVVLPAAPQHTAAWLCEDVEGRVANASATPWPPCDALKVV